MEIGWIMGGFFVFVTMLFVVIAFFLPEWVGITGKKAQQIMEEQKSERKEPDSSSRNPQG